MMNVIQPDNAKADAEFEAAMVDIVRNAKDGQGLRVRLYSGDLSAEGLREATRIFAENILPRGTMFLCGPDDELGISTNAEAAAWDNLALLARATAAAIRAGK